MDQPPGAGRLSEVHFVRHGAGGSAHRDLALSYTGPSPTGDHPKWWWSFRFSPKAINQVPSKKDKPTAREVEGGLGKNPRPSFGNIWVALLWGKRSITFWKSNWG